LALTLFRALEREEKRRDDKTRRDEICKRMIRFQTVGRRRNCLSGAASNAKAEYLDVAAGGFGPA
jgi:hypothetical protein